MLLMTFSGLSCYLVATTGAIAATGRARNMAWFERRKQKGKREEKKKVNKEKQSQRQGLIDQSMVG